MKRTKIPDEKREHPLFVLRDIRNIDPYLSLFSSDTLSLQSQEELSPFVRLSSSHTLRYQWLTVNYDNDTMDASIIESADR